MRVFRGLCQFNRTNVMSRSLVLFLTFFNGYQRYGHSKYTFHHSEKRENSGLNWIPNRHIREDQFQPGETMCCV